MKLDSLSPPWGRLMPFPACLPGVGRNELRADAIAGFTGAIVVVATLFIVIGVERQLSRVPCMISAMAGVLFLVARGLVDFKTIRPVLHASKSETSVLAVTLVSAIFLELEFAIFTCVLLLLVLHPDSQFRPRSITRAPDPRLPNRAFSSDPDRPQCPQVRFLRIDGSQFFGAGNHVQRAFDRLPAEHPGSKHLALIAEGRNCVDLPGAEALMQEAKTRKAQGRHDFSS